jgi:hypothetical protein
MIDDSNQNISLLAITDYEWYFLSINLCVFLVAFYVAKPPTRTPNLRDVRLDVSFPWSFFSFLTFYFFRCLLLFVVLLLLSFINWYCSLFSFFFHSFFLFLSFFLSFFLSYVSLLLSMIPWHCIPVKIFTGVFTTLTSVFTAFLSLQPTRCFLVISTLLYEILSHVLYYLSCYTPNLHILWIAAIDHIFSELLAYFP